MTTPLDLHPDLQYPWVTTPLSLLPIPLHPTENRDPYTLAATTKTLFTNTLIRALNSIYLQAPHIPPNLYTDFTSYSLTVYQCLTIHHRAEAEYLFPEFEKSTREVGMRHQHTDFVAGKKAWGRWLGSCLTRKNNFSADMCRMLMDDFLPALHTHFSDTVPALLALSRLGSSLDIKELSRREGELVLKRLSKTTELPAMLCNFDIAFEGGKHTFPEVSGVSGWLVKNWYARSKKGWWRFATCGRDGRPKRLEFVGVEGEGRE